MNKRNFGILLTVISVGIIGGALYANGTERSESDSSMASTQNSHFNETHKDDGHHDDEMAATNKVEIKDYEFKPGDIKVKVGTTVTWTNRDSAKHDISPVMESADFAASKLLSKGESYSFTFNKAGVYEYNCSPHPYMKAKVEVTE